jgi:hypothetical protein
MYVAVQTQAYDNQVQRVLAKAGEAEDAVPFVMPALIALYIDI